jgi:hypothetical protein
MMPSRLSTTNEKELIVVSIVRRRRLPVRRAESASQRLEIARRLLAQATKQSNIKEQKS